MSGKVILAVDDEEHILDLICYNLESSGYVPIRAETGEEGLEILDKREVDLVLLDLMLPGIDGIEVLKRIRSQKHLQRLPIIMLTAKSDEISKVIGLELGADDYVGKPFGVHELLARMKAVLRRVEKAADTKEQEEDKIIIDDITIDTRTRMVTAYEQVLDLPLKEFELLYLLAKNRGKVFSREGLLEKIWGYDYLGETRTVDVHIRNLRKKIEKDDNHPEHIKTVRGVGYKLI